MGDAVRYAKRGPEDREWAWGVVVQPYTKNGITASVAKDPISIRALKRA